MNRRQQKKFARFAARVQRQFSAKVKWSPFSNFAEAEAPRFQVCRQPRGQVVAPKVTSR